MTIQPTFDTLTYEVTKQIINLYGLTIEEMELTEDQLERLKTGEITKIELNKLISIEMYL